MRMDTMESGDPEKSVGLGDRDYLESLIATSEPDAINAYDENGEPLLFATAVSNLNYGENSIMIAVIVVVIVKRRRSSRRRGEE